MSMQVLGAAMFYVRVGQQSFLYTGDYNMTPDRHLGTAISRARLADSGKHWHVGQQSFLYRDTSLI